MLGRLITSAGAIRIGQKLIQRGSAMRAAAAARPREAQKKRTAAIIDAVRSRTRGVDHAKATALYSKHTASGRARRLHTAQLIRGRRAGLPAGQTHASFAAARADAMRAASRARSTQIVRNVKGVTRSMHPAHQLVKTNTTGRFSRQLLAQHLKAARKAPTQWGSMGPVHHFAKKRKFQGGYDMTLKNSTKTSRKKVVSKVKTATYGVAIGMNRNLISNQYAGKKYGPHRKAVAEKVRSLRASIRGRGISPSSPAVRGAASISGR